METLEFNFMETKKSTLIHKCLVQLTEFPEFLKDDNKFYEFFHLLYEKLFIEMEKEKQNNLKLKK